MQQIETGLVVQLVRRMARWSICLVCLFTLTVLLVPGMSSAQVGTANISGTVVDPTGAVVANATVAITEEATQVKHSTVSSSSGVYSFPGVPIGTYNLTVTATGFKTYTQKGIVLEVGSSISVNPTLAIGTTSQSVEVQAEGLALQTEDATLKSTVDTKTMTEMPLNSRQMTDLVKIQGGAVLANQNSDLTGSKSFFSSQPISITGGQGNGTDYRLDGGDHNDYMTNVNLPFPFPDAVSEFAVETTAQGAQSGLHPGGLVNVVTRSGTNELHGDAFEFIRNNYIDATNFFSPAGHKDTLHQDQFGGVIGGKLISNKLFFFGGYQRLRAVQATSSTNATVPTPAMLAGCFSNYPWQLVNPWTGAALGASPDGSCSVNYIDPNGVNAASPAGKNFSPAALKLASYLATPSAAALQTGTGAGFTSYSTPSAQFENVYITREDWTINQKHSLYGRFMWDGYQNLAYFDPKNILVTTNAGNQEHVDGIVIGETWIVAPSIVNSFHADATRRVNDRGPAATGINPGTLGVTNFYNTTNIGTNINIGSGAQGFNVYCGKCSLATFNVNTFAFSDDLDWVKGKHEIQIGGEFVRSQFNSNNFYYGNGTFQFNGQFALQGPALALPVPTLFPTAAPGTKVSAVPMLDFLTGAMNAFYQSKPQQNALRAPIPDLYVQDTYHLNKNVVLTAGVRWNPEIFPTDYFGRGSTFVYNDFVSGKQSSVFTSAPAGSYFYGDPGVPKSFTQNSWWQFSPRVGATWDPKGNGKTVLRVGGGIVYDEPNFFSAERQQDNPPYGLQINQGLAGAPNSFDNPWAVGTITTNPFPLPSTPTQTTPFLKNGGYQFIELPKQFQAPYMIQWTFSVQQEFAHGWQATVDYIGNRTDHGAYGFPFDTATYIPGTWGAGGTGCTGFVTGPKGSGLGTAGAAGSACSQPSNYAGRYILNQANSNWGPAYGGGGSSIYVETGANSSYNGLIGTIRHPLSSNFVLMSNFTWSHCIDIYDNPADVSGASNENPFNIKMDRGSCGFDYREVFNATVVASSHFNFNRTVNYIVNDWEISPLIHASSGMPWGVTTGQDQSLIGINQDRPNLINSANVYTHNNIATNPVFANSSAFAANAVNTFGNVGRFSLNGPKYFNMDMALNRSFALHERLALNLRLEAFDVLNHPNFAAPNSSGYLGSTQAINSATFGKITSTLWNASTGLNGIPARLFQGAAKITF